MNIKKYSEKEKDFKIFLMSQASYFKYQLAPEDFLFYWDDLKNYDEKKVYEAFEYHRKHGHGFMPKISDIVKLIDGQLQHKALNAWFQVFNNYSGYFDFEFADKTIHAVIMSLGGWVSFCEKMINLNDYQFEQMKKDFLSLYESYSKNPPQEIPEVLIGQFTINNANLTEILLIEAGIKNEIKRIGFENVKRIEN